MDTARESTIILISGDSDFIYVLSMLRLRKFNVILIAPWTARRGFKYQASATYDYPSMAFDAGHNRNRSSTSQNGLPTPPTGQLTISTLPGQVPPSPLSVNLAPSPSPLLRPAVPAGASTLGGARLSSSQHAQTEPLNAAVAAASTAHAEPAGSTASKRSFAEAVARRPPPMGASTVCCSLLLSLSGW